MEYLHQSLKGIGSIAPALIGDVLLGVQCALDEKVRDQIITLNAGKYYLSDDEIRVYII